MPNDQPSPVHVPPFHVQSAEGPKRNGFPYRSYHDSVSAFWKERWRPHCLKQAYPFGEGNVVDFDPVFDELVRLSGDSPEILYRPDEYARPFFPVAESLEAQAGETMRTGNPEKAKDLYLRAAAVYRIARAPINRSPLSNEAWERGKRCYLAGGGLLSSPVRAVQIPFSHRDAAAGDLDRPVEAYLQLPTGEPPADGWPLLLFICGLDAYRTDETTRAQKHLDAGVATLIYEIPGTGDCPAASNDPASPDRLLDSILAWVDAESVHLGLNSSQVFARGISTGGYYAIRAAHTHADRLRAAVAQGGSCHHMFNADWIGAQDQMDYPFALAEALAHKFGYRGADAVEEYKEDAGKFSLLLSGVLDRPATKLLLVNGIEDSVFPIEDSFLASLRSKTTDLMLEGGRGHMGGTRSEALVYVWLRESESERR